MEARDAGVPEVPRTKEVPDMLPFATRRAVVTDPPIARLLFEDTRVSWLWLVVRLYLGYTWLSSGLGKFGNPAWMGDGSALRGYWTNAVAIPAGGRPPVTFDWYREFLALLLNGGHEVWFAKVVVLGELAVGVALVLGAFVGVAAFFGAFMNWNFMMAGSASTNPVLFVLALLLILAWKTAGYVGLDRVLLPLLGTPWRPGISMERNAAALEPPKGTERAA